MLQYRYSPTEYLDTYNCWSCGAEFTFGMSITNPRFCPLCGEGEEARQHEVD